MQVSRSLTAGALMALMAGSAWAQSPAPDFRLPPSPTPTPAPRVQGPEIGRPSAPTPTPTPPPPAAAPAPTPTPTPAPTPSAPPPLMIQPLPPQPATPSVEAPSRGSAPRGAPQPTQATPSTPPAATNGPAAPVPASPPPSNAVADEAPAAAPQSSGGGGSQPTTPRWLWLAVGAAISLALALLLFRRRKPAGAEHPVDETVPQPIVPSAPPTRAPRAPVTGKRPWIALEFEAVAARASLVGATVGYRLTVRNSGNEPATGIAIAATIGNAAAAQDGRLQSFFAAPVETAAHSIDELAPGAELVLTGELLMPQEAYHPVTVQNRILLIPMVAFNVKYGWSGGRIGQTAAAYIVGSENEPPSEKLAAFRLDQGPRQFKAVGARKTEAALSA